MLHCIYANRFFFVILYRFLNQCFGNLAPGIVTFVTAEITVQIYMQHKIKLQLRLNQMNEINHNSYIKLPSFI